jgi:predicted metal-dependent HD superfamily phosphohydrolase
MDDDLLRRWADVLPNHPEIGEDLLRRYAEPHRRYHTTRHLADVLGRIDELASGSEDLFLVRLAAWFHDAVYAVPPGQVSNEEASARLAIRTLGRAGLEQEDLNQVARLVRLTETHVPGARDPEGELLCDADLAILAAPPEEYARYVEQVRAEYAAVPERAFLAGRLAVLTELADREITPLAAEAGGRSAPASIFRTAKGRRRLTSAARANVAAEMESLARRLGTAVEGSAI